MLNFNTESQLENLIIKYIEKNGKIYFWGKTVTVKTKSTKKIRLFVVHFKLEMYTLSKGEI